MITADFTLQDLEDDINDSLDSIIEDIAAALFSAGQKVVDLAREKTKSEGGFGNITWALRASIGCVLVFNGQIKDEYIYFPPTTKGTEGHEIGISFAREIALLTNDGDPTLILVAGMEYAGYVEGRGDFDVITGSSLRLDKLFKALL